MAADPPVLKPPLTIEFRDPRTLQANEANYRHHPREQIADIQRSLRDLGQYRNVVVREDGVLLAGHGVVQAACEMGWTEIAVHVFRGTEAQARLLMVVDNEVSRGAEDDERALHALLNEINRDFGDLQGTGWTDAEHEARLAELAAEDYGAQKAEQEDPGAGEAPEDPQTKLGDAWLCGEHRVVCGDATLPETWPARTDMVMTSPPYWVGKVYEQEQSWPEVQSFILRTAAVMAERTVEHGRIVINTGTVQAGRFFGGDTQMRLLLDDWQRALGDAGWLLRYPRLWLKRGQLPHTAPAADVIDVHWEFVGVFYYRPGYRAPQRVGEEWALEGYWEFHGERSSCGHEAAFPVEVPLRNIRLYTAEGEHVTEPFLGSGTTLIAAEQLGRVCYGIEIEPRYVDVAVRRWAQMTGQVPVLESDGTQFEV